MSAVVTAAVGGAVLALEAWPAWLRYALGSVSLLAAFIGALRPSDYLRRDLLRMDQYSALHRQIWQYLLLELPWATERAATDRAIEFGHALDTVLGIELNVTRAGTAHAQRDAASGHD